MSEPKSKTEIEKNIWVPTSILLGIVMGYGVDPSILKYAGGFLLFAIIFWCIKWLRVK